jgi:hypothetical protein
MMNRLPKQPHPFGKLSGCFVAGGAILSAVTKTEPADYDIYPKSRAAAVDLIFELMEDNCFIVNISDRAVTLKSNSNTNSKGERILVQVMMFDEFETADKIFEFFDFTVCMAAFDCDTNEYQFHPDFFIDVAAKTLRFNPKTKYPLNSMMRLGKYHKKGYTLPSSEMIRMSLTLMQSKLPTSWEELETVIGGTYGQQAKLHTEGLEFSIENALKFFDDLDVTMLLPDLETDFSNFKAEDFDTVFSNDIKWYKHILPASSMLREDNILISETGTILRDCRTAFQLADIFGVEFEEWDVEKPLFGYKTFNVMEDGTLQNSVYSGKKITYRVGEWTEEESHPHIFVHTKVPTISSYQKPAVYKVKYFAPDIVTVGNDLTVKKVCVVSYCYKSGDNKKVLVTDDEIFA